VGHTYDLFITTHAPGLSDDRKRPPLESKLLFRAHEGYLALDFWLRRTKTQQDRSRWPIIRGPGKCLLFRLKLKP